MKYKVKEIFYTQDGSWEPDNGKKYSVTRDMVNKYHRNEFLSKGCATCLFVRVEGDSAAMNQVEFSLPTGDKFIRKAEDGGWAHITIFHSSAFNPEVGEQGPWELKVLGGYSEVVGGLGLPFGWRVSTFVVFQAEEDDTQPSPPNPPPGPPPVDPDPKKVIEVVFNGNVVFRMEV